MSEPDPGEHDRPSPSRERLELALAAGQMGVWDWDIARDEIVVSEALARPHGVAEIRVPGGYEEFLGNVAPEDRAAVDTAVRKALESENTYEATFRYRVASGDIRWVHDAGVVHRDADGVAIRMVGVTRDVTREREIEAALRASEDRYRHLFEHNPQPMWVYDLETLCFLAVNHAAVDQYGWPESEMLAMTIRDIRPPEEVPALLRSLEDTSSLSHSGIWRHQTRDGRVLDVEVHSHTVEFEGRPARMVLGLDVTHRARAQERLAFQALHDPLTGLANRALLLDRLRHALARAVRRPGTLAVLFVDLDRFKLVNDSLGHEVGDRLLVAVARRLQSVLRPEDTVARLAGDEFVVLCEEITGEHEARALATRITVGLNRPFTIDDRELYVAASVGVAVASGAEHESPDALLRDADMAMYRAKELGRGRFEVFDDTLRVRSVERQQIENDLRRAIDRNELRLVYQPVVDLGTGRAVAVEALLRWEHPEHGLIAPARFLDVAEDTGLIVPLSGWALAEACRTAATWTRIARDPITVAVNTSIRQVTLAEFPEMVAVALAQAGLEPGRLCLELAESVRIDDDDRALASLQTVIDTGVQLAVEEFGSGLSSMGHLRRLPPLRSVKIGRAFVGALGRTPEDTSVIEATVALAHALGVRVTAVGVEDGEQLAALRAIGCDEAQGQWFCRPLPAVAIEHLLRQGKSW